MNESSKPSPLPSSVERRLHQLRSELVLQLFMKRGPLWEAVRGVRDRWNIAVKVQLPPSFVGWLLPEGAPDIDRKKYPAYAPRPPEYWKYLNRWEEEMDAIRLRVVPKPDVPTREYSDFQWNRHWNNFLSACVLYDPPDDRLVEFASSGNLEPSYGNLDPTVREESRVPEEDNPKEIPEMVDPPIKTLWGLMALRDRYWERILDYIGERYLEPYIGERYLEPQNVDVESMVSEIMVDIPGLLEEQSEEYKQYSQRYYIEVNEYTNLDDVRNAFSIIRWMQPHKRTKQGRDRLVSVQCAILYDRFNQVDPEDKRRRKWTHKKLADHFGLSSYRAAKDHVTLGREILEGTDPAER